MKNVNRVLNCYSGKIERQLTESDCAVWAIKAACFQLGVSVPPAKLVRRHIDLDGVGTTVRGVRDALCEFGISAQPVQGPSDAIADAPLPAIALIRLGDFTLHYVVVIQTNHRWVRFLDPAIGGSEQKVDAKRFASMFTGNLILCERKPDYVTADFGKEVSPEQFLCGALAHESNAAVALALGEIIQLSMLLVGILLLKCFFSSSTFGMPNFWFLAGIAVCAAVYLWIGRLNQLIQSDVKSRSLLNLFSAATTLIGKSNAEPKIGLRESASRCVNSVTTVSHSLASGIMLPGNTISLILFIALIMCIDVYAACYAIGLAIFLPLFGLWHSRRMRTTARTVSRTKDHNEMGLICLLAKAEQGNEVTVELPWSHLSYCDALAKQDDQLALDNAVSTCTSRLSIFAGLLIGGLQHATLGIGHTIAVFFLLSIFSTVVIRWAKRVASIPEYRFNARALLDFLSDFSDGGADDEKAKSDAPDSGLPVLESIGHSPVNARRSTA